MIQVHTRDHKAPSLLTRQFNPLTCAFSCAWPRWSIRFTRMERHFDEANLYERGPLERLAFQAVEADAARPSHWICFYPTSKPLTLVAYALGVPL